MSSAAAGLARLSKHLGELDRILVRTAGDVVSKALVQRAARDTGGDGMMSGFVKGRKSRGALDVDVKPLGKAGVSLIPRRAQAGMWAVLDGGAKPHATRLPRGAARPTRGKGRRSNRVRGVPGHVHSPPKRTWHIARDQAMPKAVDAVRDEFHKAVN